MDRTVNRAVLAFVCLALAIGCEERTLAPRGELLVYVDTNAPLALAPGEVLASDIPAPLFDRLRLELLDAEGALACDDCARDFAVSRDLLAARQLAFGLLPRANRTDLVLRARLFKGSRTRGGVPSTDATIDRAFVAPPVGAEGVVEVTAFLALDAVGEGPNLDAPESMATSKPGPAGLDPRALPAPCTTAAGQGEVCVPGGAFWMSDPSILPSPDGTETPSRVITLSPFYIDAHEVTVAELRASGVAITRDPRLSDGSPAACTFTATPGPMDDLPVTCITWTRATQYCAAKGARLPTEAEIEFLLSRRLSSRYVWGQDDPDCEDVVTERVDPAGLPGDTFVLTSCARQGIGPARAGTGRRDAAIVGAERIVDLAGNVAEWTKDTFEALGNRCWGAGLAVDPVCERASNARTLRGGSWELPRGDTRSTYRSSALEFRQTPSVGFRCARPGR